MFDRRDDYNFDLDFDGDADLDFDLDGDAGFGMDGGFERDTDRGADHRHDGRGAGRQNERGWGVGMDRDDVWEATGMPMTRRDLDALRRDAVQSTAKFLNKRRPVKESGPDLATLAIMIAAVLGGAGAGGYFAQRFRMSGAVVPVGVTGSLLLGLAAYYGAIPGKKIVLPAAVGLGASALALWGAGKGVQSAAERDQPTPATAGLLQALGMQAGVPGADAAPAFTPPAFAPAAPPVFTPAPSPPPGPPMDLEALRNLYARSAA